MTAEPLWPFGFGLSYTTYRYSKLQVSKHQLHKSDVLTVSVDVENTGARDGAEIVQLYINDLYSSVVTPIKELRGFLRIHLKPGEKKHVNIELPISNLSLINAEGKEVVESGDFEIMVGSSSKDSDLLKTTISVL